jgi:hypothetical protein
VEGFVLEVYEDEGRIENFKCEPLSRDLDESGGRAVLERSPELGGALDVNYGGF